MVVQEGEEGVMLDRVEYPELRHGLGRVGVADVTQLTHHHSGHPGGVDHLPASQLDQLAQVSSLHPALGAHVDRTNP